jgi:hypothetical protein
VKALATFRSGSLSHSRLRQQRRPTASATNQRLPATRLPKSPAKRREAAGASRSRASVARATRTSDRDASNSLGLDPGGAAEPAATALSLAPADTEAARSACRDHHFSWPHAAKMECVAVCFRQQRCSDFPVAIWPRWVKLGKSFLQEHTGEKIEDLISSSLLHLNPSTPCYYVNALHFWFSLQAYPEFDIYPSSLLF